MTKPYFSLQRDDGVVTLTLDRVARHNALPPEAHHALAEAFDALAADDDVRVVIVTGAGEKAFCAGYDLADGGDMEISAKGFGGLTFRTDFPHPLIAAVNGVAMGGGFELALACDIILAADTAKFALPEPKVGWVALGGGIQRLPRAIGDKRAMAMILTGRAVDAAEGMALGFVNEVIEPARLMDRAREVAAEIVACAPLAVRFSKAAVGISANAPDLAAALDPATYPGIDALFASADAAEGLRAFAERRPPTWSGK